MENFHNIGEEKYRNSRNITPVVLEPPPPKFSKTRPKKIVKILKTTPQVQMLIKALNSSIQIVLF